MSVIIQQIQSKLGPVKSLYPNCTVKVSSEIRSNASFLRIIDRKFHFRYIGVSDTVASIFFFFEYLASRRCRVS